MLGENNFYSSSKGALARGHLVQHDAQGILVAGGGGFGTASGGLFGTYLRRRADNFVVEGAEGFVAGPYRYAEVGQRYVAKRTLAEQGI